MSQPDDPTLRILEALLAGAPQRTLDAMTGQSRELRTMLDESQQALALSALPQQRVSPSPQVREKLAQWLHAHPKKQKRKAVIVLDMLVDHLTPGKPLEVPRARAIIPAVKTRIDSARKNGEPIIYACDRHTPDDPELLVWPAHSIADTEGANVVPELAPLSSDYVIPHRTYSAFYQTQLEQLLHSLSVNSIVLTGCITELGLFATATDALMRGFHVEVPPECQAGSSAVAEKIAMSTLSVMAPFQPITG